MEIQSQKLNSLPDDLRSVADAMLREKFPGDNLDEHTREHLKWVTALDDGFKNIYKEHADRSDSFSFWGNTVTQSNSVGAELTEESLQKAVDVMKNMQNNGYDTIKYYKWPHSYGKSEYFRRMYENSFVGWAEEDIEKGGYGRIRLGVDYGE